MGIRESVLQKITEEVGFPFIESELSPSLRTKIRKLAKKHEQLQSLYYKKTETPLIPLLFWVVAIVGLSTLVFGFILTGVGILFGAGLIVFVSSLYLGVLLTRVQSESHSKFLEDLEMEILYLSNEFEDDLNAVSKLIVKELAPKKDVPASST